MKQYKIKVIALLVRPNRMAKHGEILTKANFFGKVDDLVKGGYIEEVVGNAPSAAEQEENTDEVKADEVKADEVKADEVKADEVKADEVKADEVKADEVKKNPLLDNAKKK